VTDIDIERFTNRLLLLRVMDNTPIDYFQLTEVEWKIYKEVTRQIKHWTKLPILYKDIKSHMWDNIRYIDWISYDLLKSASRETLFIRNELLIMHDIDQSKFILDLINWKITQEYLNNIFKYENTKPNLNEIKSKARKLFNLEEWENLMMWFGDKDWFAMVYKNDYITSWIQEADKQKVLDMWFSIDYMYSW